MTREFLKFFCAEPAWWLLPLLATLAALYLLDGAIGIPPFLEVDR